MTPTLTTIGHRTAFNNEQIHYRIVSYRRPRNDNVKQFKRENCRPYFCTKKKSEKQIYNTKQTTTTELQDPALEQALT